MRARVFLAAAAAVFSSSALFAAPQSVSFPCPDGSARAALFVQPKPNAPVFILLHGLASTKNEWTPFLDALEKKGWGALAYDMRAPGTPWPQLVDDVGAALRYLEKEKSVERRQIFLGGASLGANVVLKYHVLTSNGAAVILLSPGLNYQELTTDDLI